MARSFVFFLLAALLAGLVAGCGSDAEDVGVVARVNGQPIYLTDLEAKYDLNHLNAVSSSPPSPENLKKEYTAILKDLIAQQLVSQVLEEKGIPVSEDELNRAEAKVRMDYPKGGFEQVLIEEYIDLDTWRQQLAAYLSYEKFLDTILKPKIALQPDEIAAYYQENKTSFVVPPRIVCLRAKGPKLDAVKHVLKLLDKGVPPEQLRKQFPSVAVEKLVIPEGQLPESKSRVLRKLKPGEVSTANAADVGFEGFLLEKRLPEKQQELGEVKKELLQTMMENKLQQAYVAWLENELASSKISISEHLLDSDAVVARAAERQRNASAWPGEPAENSKKAPAE